MDRIYSKSQLFFMFGSGKYLSIVLALVISLFKVVTRVSQGLPLNPSPIPQSKISLSSQPVYRRTNVGQPSSILEDVN